MTKEKEEKIDRIIKKLIKLNLVNLEKLETLDNIRYENVCNRENQDSSPTRQGQSRKVD